MSRQITFAELNEHTTENDLWLLIDGKVTKFLPEHPGGDEVMIAEAGKDCTEHFEDVGHSDDAREQLKGMLIGVLSDPENVPASGSKLDAATSDGGFQPYVCFANNSPLVMILGVVGVVGYFVYSRFLK